MAQIDGVWDTEAKSSIGVDRSTLTLQTTPDGRLTGQSVNVKDGTVIELEDGRYEGNKLFYKASVRKPIKVTLKIEVTITGDTLEGVASAGLLGKATMTGTRRS